MNWLVLLQHLFCVFIYVLKPVINGNNEAVAGTRGKVNVLTEHNHLVEIGEAPWGGIC